jgi:hypothetical protein
MTTRTRADLITEVLDQLGVTAIGQVPAADDVNKVDTRLDNMLEEISALGIYTVIDSGSVGPQGGDIDAAALRSLGAMVANMCAANFGLGADPSLDVMARRAEHTLRTIERPARSRRFMETDPAIRSTRLWPGRGSFSNGT